MKLNLINQTDALTLRISLYMITCFLLLRKNTIICAILYWKNKFQIAEKYAVQI